MSGNFILQKGYGKDKKTEVKSQKCYHKAEMEDLAKRLHNLNIKPYTPTKEQQKRILKFWSKLYALKKQP